MPTSPTARALECLFLLQERPGVTAAGLAERLGVSERAARQYVTVLREAGVPVESVRGRYGGYRLGRGLRLPPVVFSAAEALAPDAGERCRIVGTTDDPWWYAEQLVRLRTPYTVVGGEELRETTAALGRRMLAAVADPG